MCLNHPSLRFALQEKTIYVTPGRRVIHKGPTRERHYWAGVWGGGSIATPPSKRLHGMKGVSNNREWHLTTGPTQCTQTAVEPPVDRQESATAARPALQITVMYLPHHPLRPPVGRIPANLLEVRWSWGGAPSCCPTVSGSIRGGCC